MTGPYPHCSDQSARSVTTFRLNTLVAYRSNYSSERACGVWMGSAEHIPLPSFTPNRDNAGVVEGAFLSPPFTLDNILSGVKLRRGRKGKGAGKTKQRLTMVNLCCWGVVTRRCPLGADRSSRAPHHGLRYRSENASDPGGGDIDRSLEGRFQVS